MKRKIIGCIAVFAVILFALMFFACTNPSGGGGSPELPSRYIYVTDIIDVAGTGDGSSWTTAMNDVQDAIDLAAGLTGAAKTYVLIKAGTYYPQGWPNKDIDSEIDDTNERHKHFSLRNGVVVIGGFDGDETGIEPRKTSPTILSGDLSGDDISGDWATNKSDNVRHVFYHPEGLYLTKTAELRNVKITRGYARSDDGGGILNVGSCPSIIDCIFSENYTTGFGGGIANREYSNPGITNCTFSGNPSSQGGSGIYNDLSGPTITGCIFSENIVSGGKGTGIFNKYSSPTITGCTFSDNTMMAYSDGGGICNEESNPIITNCTFINNLGRDGGGIFNITSNSIITNCTFSENNVSEDGGGISNYYCSPTITNCTFSGNSAPNNFKGYGGGIYNWASNPVIQNCTFSENEARYGGGIYNVENSNGNTSNPEIITCTFSGNTASNSGGGMYSGADCHPKVYGTIIVGNTAATSIPNADAGTFDSSSGDNVISDDAADVSLIFKNVSAGKAELKPNGGLTETLMVNEYAAAQITLPVTGWTIPSTDQRGAPRSSAEGKAYKGAVDPRVSAP